MQGATRSPATGHHHNGFGGGERQEETLVVKKTKLLIGLKEEVIKLKLLLTEEVAEREKISEWIKATLRPSLQNLKNNVAAKFSELEESLEQEKNAKEKIIEWIK